MPDPVDDVTNPAGLPIGRAEASRIGNHALTLPCLSVQEPRMMPPCCIGLIRMYNVVSCQHSGYQTLSYAIMGWSGGLIPVSSGCTMVPSWVRG